ncbi:NAD(P)H-dependent oxidoreductase [Vibrio sp. ER1A]|uniref:NAD(P)H-dependent oxidoreductase n=1 Tax=Vibrio sp. ER1A TaxID=1517681 RepID=UPI0004DD82EE|nr:NAD(P)H-dependent oxidoreductase [Vibrio sp. ER1A]KFA98837.1 FMN reductase [Vibrio sp. ER1A]
MSQVLVISGHPNLDASNTNKVILNQLSDHFDDIEVRQLDRLYPNYQIDVEAEQAALVKADVVVLQFPFYWYSIPALLKKWIDDVFSYNFAYGAKGDKLKGKDLVLSFTIGGPEESYTPLGYNHFSIEELLKPLEQTAYLAGMNYVKPVYTHSMVYIAGVYNTLEEVETRARSHADRLQTRIEDLIQSPENRISKFVTQWFAQFDELPDSTDDFTRYLSADIKWSAPEGTFYGHDGFRDWYSIVKRTFKPDCHHQIEQIEVRREGNHYAVELRMRLLADTYSESTLRGESINLLVNEVWKVSLDGTRTTIHDYHVDPVI